MAHEVCSGNIFRAEGSHLVSCWCRSCTAERAAPGGDEGAAGRAPAAPAPCGTPMPSSYSELVRPRWASATAQVFWAKHTLWPSQCGNATRSPPMPSKFIKGPTQSLLLGLPLRYPESVASSEGESLLEASSRLHMSLNMQAARKVYSTVLGSMPGMPPGLCQARASHGAGMRQSRAAARHRGLAAAWLCMLWCGWAAVAPMSISSHPKLARQKGAARLLSQCCKLRFTAVLARLLHASIYL